MDARTTADVRSEIRAWVGRRDLSQSDIARKLGVPPSWMSKRLSGGTELSLEDLFAISEVLGVSPIVFFEGPRHDTELRPTRYNPSQGGTARVQRACVAA